MTRPLLIISHPRDIGLESASQRVEDGGASITLTRPHRKNAITGPLADGLADAFRAVSARDDVNVVLLSGAGGGFCSGLDLVEYNADPPPPWMSTATESLVAANLAIFDCPVPVVGALERFGVHGGARRCPAGCGDDRGVHADVPDIQIILQV